MKSLINPFSVLRHLDFWSVVAFDTGGGSSGGGIGVAVAPVVVATMGWEGRPCPRYG
jgi:hypothetical protein